MGSSWRMIVYLVDLHAWYQHLRLGFTYHWTGALIYFTILNDFYFIFHDDSSLDIYSSLPGSLNDTSRPTRKACFRSTNPLFFDKHLHTYTATTLRMTARFPLPGLACLAIRGNFERRMEGRKSMEHQRLAIGYSANRFHTDSLSNVCVLHERHVCIYSLCTCVGIQRLGCPATLYNYTTLEFKTTQE